MKKLINKFLVIIFIIFQIHSSYALAPQSNKNVLKQRSNVIHNSSIKNKILVYFLALSSSLGVFLGDIHGAINDTTSILKNNAIQAASVQTPLYTGGDWGQVYEAKYNGGIYTNLSGPVFKYKKNSSSNGGGGIYIPLRMFDLDDNKIILDLNTYDKEVTFDVEIRFSSYSIGAYHASYGSFTIPVNSTNSIEISKDSIKQKSDFYLKHETINGSIPQIAAINLIFKGSNDINSELWVNDIKIINLKDSLKVPNDIITGLEESIRNYFIKTVPYGDSKDEYGLLGLSILNTRFSTISHLFDNLLLVDYFLSKESEDYNTKAEQILETIKNHWKRKAGSSNQDYAFLLLTVIETVNTLVYEAIMDNGVRAHVALKFLKYASMVNDTNTNEYIVIAENIWKNIKTYEVSNGSGAYFAREVPDGKGGYEIDKRILGEHMVDFYALTDFLYKVTSKDIYKVDRDNIFNYIKQYMWDDSFGIKIYVDEKGQGPLYSASDIIPWAIMAMGVKKFDELSGKPHTAYDLLVNNDEIFKTTIDTASGLCVLSDFKDVILPEFTEYYIEAIDRVIKAYIKTYDSVLNDNVARDSLGSGFLNDLENKISKLRSIFKFYRENMDSQIVTFNGASTHVQAIFDLSHKNAKDSIAIYIPEIGNRLMSPSLAPTVARILEENDVNIFSSEKNIEKELYLVPFEGDSTSNVIDNEFLDLNLYFNASGNNIFLNYTYPMNYTYKIKNIKLYTINGRMLADKDIFDESYNGAIHLTETEHSGVIIYALEFESLNDSFIYRDLFVLNGGRVIRPQVGGVNSLNGNTSPRKLMKSSA